MEVSVIEEGDSVVLTTGEAALTLCKTTGLVTLCDSVGRVLVAQPEPSLPASAEGFRAELALAPGERLYGLGDETRDRLNKRGHETAMVVRNVSSYAPVPFLKPESVLARVQLGRAREGLKDPKGALAAYQDALHQHLQLDPKGEPPIWLGETVQRVAREVGAGNP